MQWLEAGAAAAVASYVAHVGVAWCRYGHVRPAPASEADTVLDRLMPRYDVVERHHVGVSAPAAVVLAAAEDQDLLSFPPVHAIIRARECLLGAAPDPRPPLRGLLRQVQALGWVVLAEVPDREIVVGAVTKPWEPNPVTRAIPPAEFAAFAEPGYVQIAWTLRADPAGDGTSVFRTETRARATDPAARARFRWYWAWASPGITFIRWLSLGPLRREAERRSRVSGHHEPGAMLS